MSTTAAAPAKAHLLALAALSAGMLAFEVLLLRVFEYSHWHHFAGLAVALALLGLGCAGTVLALLGPRAAVLRDGWLVASVLLTAAGVGVVLLVQSRVALRPLLAGWDAAELARLLLVDAVAFLPFLAVGLGLGHAFMRWPQRPRQVYAANLLGSAAGSVGASLALGLAQVETVLAATALLLATAGVALALARRCWRAAGVGVPLLVATGLLTAAPPPPALSDFKPLARLLELPDVQVLGVAPGLRGRLTVLRSESLRIAPGLSLDWPHGVPAADAAIVGSERVVTLARDWSRAEAHLQASLVGLPERLRPGAQVLAIGAGEWGPTGRSTAARLTWVEPDARILALARARGAGGPRVELAAEHGFTHLAATGRRYDLIGLDGAHAGGDAASEDYLLTAQGLTLGLSRLREDGLLAIPLPLDYPPRHFPRVLQTLRAALLATGATAPADHVAALRGLRAVLVLVSPRPLAARDVAAVQAFAGRWGFDLVWLPGLQRARSNRHHVLDDAAFFDIAHGVLELDTLPVAATRFASGAADLDRPYLWRSLRWSMLVPILEELGPRGWSYLDWTLLLLLATSTGVVALALVLILAPLGRLPAGSGAAGRGTVVALFAALGLGYMLLELALFQRAILFLGEPVLAASIVFAVFLVGSGAGAAGAPRLPTRRTVLRTFAAIGATAALAVGVLFGAAAQLAVLPGQLRLAALVAALLPLAWALGRPFPWALQQLAGVQRWIPWAWGINGFASVLAASTATLVSVQAGQRATVLLAALCYGLAFGVSLLWTRRRELPDWPAPVGPVAPPR